MIVGLINARSMCNKTVGIMELLNDFNIDICCVTETWFKKSDKAKFSEIKDFGYETLSTPRSGRGGGVAFLFKYSLKLKKQKSIKYKTF